jgi:AcrR family transcriptional regulator
MSQRKKKRTSKAEWFEAALYVLGEEGIQGVRVERLARNLGISKSGFYWHFQDRRDLELQLLEYWAHEYTEVLSENIELNMLEPVTRLSRITQLVTEHDLSRYDHAFFAWAEHDEEVEKRVKQVMKKRLEYIGRALSQTGVMGRELDLYARLFVGYMSWESRMLPVPSRRRRTELQKLLITLLTEGASRQDTVP